ncbi:MAG: SAM-dependent methyltransferase [Clostridia bacterium]|nr:SAM-dependent methyltransferase [Clostridia bacterium]
MNRRFVHITPRLAAAADMLKGYETVADVGCDHGRLTAALLQQNCCSKVIASDISEPSLEKARDLIVHIGLADRVSFRVGDGCSVLKPGECDAIAMLGMGGTLMCRILEACSVPLAGAKALVLQPMRAQDEIREYLCRGGYRITDDRVVSDRGRLYQVFKAETGGMPDMLPDGFPEGFFDVGYRAFETGDPLLPALCREQFSCHEKMLKTARGTSGETVIQKKIDALRQILERSELRNHK